MNTRKKFNELAELKGIENTEGFKWVSQWFFTGESDEADLDAALLLAFAYNEGCEKGRKERADMERLKFRNRLSNLSVFKKGGRL